MRRAIIALSFSLIWSSGAAAQSFCSVNNYGRENCAYYTIDACERASQGNRGFCVYRPQATEDSGRAYADVGGQFRQGVEESSRPFQAERHEFPPPPKPMATETARIIAGAWREAGLRELERQVPTATLSEERIERCETARSIINAQRAYRRASGGLPMAYAEEEPYWGCLFPDTQ